MLHERKIYKAELRNDLLKHLEMCRALWTDVMKPEVDYFYPVVYFT